MTWITAMLIGVGLGLVCFGGLWFTVRSLPRFGGQALVVVSASVRLGLVGVTFYGLSRSGPIEVLAGLGGLWLARWCLVWKLGGEPRAVLRTAAKRRPGGPTVGGKRDGK
jgi:F1F0 ATPase subunit 2